MIRTLSVKSEGAGWVVDSGSDFAPLWFRGGGQAETNARQLAQLLVSERDQTQVIVHDRKGAIVGSIVYGPAPAAG